MKSNTTRKTFLSLQEKLNRVKAICDFYSTGVYTIESSCESVGVPYHSFKNWAQPGLTDEDIKSGRYRPGFVHQVHETYKEAVRLNKINFREMLKQKVREALLQKASGYSYDKVTKVAEVDGNGRVKLVSITTHTRQIMPDNSVLIFLAINLDAGNFANSERFGGTINAKV